VTGEGSFAGSSGPVEIQNAIGKAKGIQTANGKGQVIQGKRVSGTVISGHGLRNRLYHTQFA
jgi:hypothetical protein